jgi:acyl-CoA thioester hydrolase
MKPYFPMVEGKPAPLTCRVERVVRFEEVDLLQIVWHGRYTSFFEDARVALGEKYGIGYMDFYKNGVLAPIKKLHVDHHRPLVFGQRFSTEALLHWSDAARMNFEFRIRNESQELVASGYTVQMMLDLNRTTLLICPPFYSEFQHRWKTGTLS